MSLICCSLPVRRLHRLSWGTRRRCPQLKPGYMTRSLGIAMSLIGEVVPSNFLGLLQAELEVTVPDDVAEMEAAVRVREVELRAREARLLPPLESVASAHGISVSIAEQRRSVRAGIQTVSLAVFSCFTDARSVSRARAVRSIKV